MKSFRSLIVLAGVFAFGMPAWTQSNSNTSQSPQQVQEIQAAPSQIETDRTVETSVPNVAATLGRAIVFVHGWCGNDVDWNATVQTVRAELMTSDPSLYPNQSVYGAVFNGSVFFYDFFSRQIVDVLQIPLDARFFVIAFIDPRQSSAADAFNPNNVAQIPISVKANELAEILASIQDITFVQDSLVVAHSMGGLVSRAYLEGLGSPLTFTGSQYLYSPGTTTFFPNLGSIVTIDSPHAGAPVSFSEALFGSLFTCGGLNRKEMIPGDPNSVIETLNYFPGASLSGALPKTFSAMFPILSIKSYNTFDWGGTPNSDGVIEANTQDIRLALQSHVTLTSTLQSLDNFEGVIPRLFSTDCSEAGFYVLHLIKCVGTQTATLQFLLNGIRNDKLGVPLGVNSLSLASMIVGGTGAAGAVGLTSGAPVHGASVILSSDDPTVQVPTVLNIHAGMDSATFNINSSLVSSPKTVHISATYGRGNQQVALLVNPAMAQTALSSNALNFNTQLLGTRGIGQVVALNNSGTAALTITGVAVNGDFLQSNNCPQIVGIGAGCAINILFKPTALGIRTGALTITDNAPGSPHVVSLSGSGFDLVLSLGRPARPHRTTGGSTNAQKGNIILSVVGTSLLGPIHLSCNGQDRNDSCKISQQSLGNGLNIEFELKSRRSSRLNNARTPKTMTITADVGNTNRTFSIPVQ